MTLKTDGSSVAGGMDNDSADMTSEGRSFHVRAATTGKARLTTIDSLTGQRHSGTTRQTASVGRTKRSTARLVSGERRD